MGKVASLSVVELAYIAGFLDGDGTVMSLVERHSEKRFGIRIRVVVEFTQHNDNIQVLRYLRAKIGGGNIHRSLRNVWKYSIKDQQLVKKLLISLLSYSVLKKRQIKLALKVLSLTLSSPQALLRAGILSDTLSGFNLRSKSRRIHGAKTVREMISRND